MYKLAAHQPKTLAEDENWSEQHYSKPWNFRLTADQIFDIYRVFDSFDEDYDGRISTDKLDIIIRACGLLLTNQELSVIKTRESEKSSQINLPDFFVLIVELYRDYHYREILAEQAFEKLQPKLVTVSPQMTSEIKETPEKNNPLPNPPSIMSWLFPSSELHPTQQSNSVPSTPNQPTSSNQSQLNANKNEHVSEDRLTQLPNQTKTQKKKDKENQKRKKKQINQEEKEKEKHKQLQQQQEEENKKEKEKIIYYPLDDFRKKLIHRGQVFSLSEYERFEQVLFEKYLVHEPVVYPPPPPPSTPPSSSSSSSTPSSSSPPLLEERDGHRLVPHIQSNEINSLLFSSLHTLILQVKNSESDREDKESEILARINERSSPEVWTNLIFGEKLFVFCPQTYPTFSSILEKGSNGLAPSFKYNHNNHNHNNQHKQRVKIEELKEEKNEEEEELKEEEDIDVGVDHHYVSSIPSPSKSVKTAVEKAEKKGELVTETEVEMMIEREVEGEINEGGGKRGDVVDTQSQSSSSSPPSKSTTSPISLPSDHHLSHQQQQSMKTTTTTNNNNNNIHNNNNNNHNIHHLQSCPLIGEALIDVDYVGVLFVSTQCSHSQSFITHLIDFYHQMNPHTTSDGGNKSFEIIMFTIASNEEDYHHFLTSFSSSSSSSSSDPINFSIIPWLVPAFPPFSNKLFYQMKSHIQSYLLSSRCFPLQMIGTQNKPLQPQQPQSTATTTTTPTNTSGMNNNFHIQVPLDYEITETPTMIILSGEGGYLRDLYGRETIERANWNRRKQENKKGKESSTQFDDEEEEENERELREGKEESKNPFQSFFSLFSCLFSSEKFDTMKVLRVWEPREE